jgi:Ca-activated chloride channel family protein
LRLLSLFLLVFLIARPQLVDHYSKIKVEGIDIFLALDVSGSMQLYDSAHEERNRFEIAKAEALKFMQKRENDALGLVIFGKYAVSRCPLTLDKKILEDIISELELGFIDPNGTVLARALVTAANRLKHSQAKSRVIILITDGSPSADDIAPDLALKLLQELKIKVYTIAIGDPAGAYLATFFGRQAVPVELDLNLLKKIARETGGASFIAKNSRELNQIYEKIDQLERVEHKTDVFTNLYELAWILLLAIMGLILLELLLRSVVWRGLNT